MKKVLHLRSSFDPGGTETLLLNLFNYDQDHFLIHFVLLKDGSLVSHLAESGANSAYRWYRKRYFDFSVLKKMIRLIQKEEIQRVHTHQFIELFYAVILKLFLPRLQIVHQIHLMFKERKLPFYLERFLSQRFARLITVSNAAKAELVESFGFDEKKISVLYNAVVINGEDQSDPAAIKAKMNISTKQGQINVVMVANFVWGKDHETIFKAYDSFIREQLPMVSFFFIGRETEISQRLKEKYLTGADLQSGRIVFTGPIPNAKSLLPLFDIVIMSCFSETFNLSLVEAASMGKVVLASDIPVFTELSENGKYFYHFKTGDAEDLFESLQFLVSNLPEVSQRNHALYFRNKYGFASFVQALDEIYNDEKV